MPLDWRSRLIDPSPAAPAGFQSLVPPVHRGSTTLFKSAAEVADHWDHERVPYSYGQYGTPTTLELSARIARLEGASYCLITPGGQAAIALISLTFSRAGGHILLPDNVYGPSRELAQQLLARLGVETQLYEPAIGGQIGRLLRRNTQLVWCESPGSVTMEIQDVPAIAEVARSAGVVTALDNTYAAGVFFDAFGHGVDVSMQALTKYIGGHSDVLLGSVTIKDPKLYQRLGETLSNLGMAVSPDDCSLALRGLKTLAVRLDRLQESALQLAGWLREQPQVQRVLHPAFASCPGHDLWQRDFLGSTSVFSVLFKPSVSRDALVQFVDALHLFKIGYSWGGVTSLVMPFFELQRSHLRYAGLLVRFNVGLESVVDLTADLASAFSRLKS
ncbi:MAG TPA: cystathionine beta-lyase [Steroidobacteraceae bacterium]|jgi:cystathionine beta-lyase